MRPAGSRASPCDSGNRSGGLGAAPPVIRFGGAVASPRRNKPLPKKAPAPPARGAFFPFHRPREAVFSRHAIRLDGGEYSPPEPELSCRFSSPPPGGDAEGGGGASFTPDGVSLGSLAQGRGKEGRERARLCPEWAQLGNGERPATLDKKKIFFFLILFNNFI